MKSQSHMRQSDLAVARKWENWSCQGYPSREHPGYGEVAFALLTKGQNSCVLFLHNSAKFAQTLVLLLVPLFELGDGEGEKGKDL